MPELLDLDNVSKDFGGLRAVSRAGRLASWRGETGAPTGAD
jgi:hypothetical protein